MGECYGIIYKATNKVNGKMYIGQTAQSLNKRISKHINDALNNRYNSYFHRAIRKYGKENFKWEIITECNSQEELNKAEVEMIEKYNTFESGYNLTKGGEGQFGFKHSKETKEKMSKRHKGKRFSEKHRMRLSESHRGEKHNNYGKHFSEETKKRMSEAQKGEKNSMYGKHHSERTKEAMSKMRKGEKHPMYGKHHSEETRNKVSDAKKGKYVGSKNPNAKNYIVTTPEGKEIFVHGLTEFCRNYKKDNLIYKSLYACVFDNQKQYKGYKCRYLEEVLDVKI